MISQRSSLTGNMDLIQESNGVFGTHRSSHPPRVQDLVNGVPLSHGIDAAVS